MFANKSLFFVFFFFLAMNNNPVFAQLKEYNVTVVDSLMKVEPRPMLFLITTDWCKYCFLQKGIVSKNARSRKEEINGYLITFNAEYKQELIFNSKTYSYLSFGGETGVHELAIALNDSESISFPTWILVNKKYEVVFRYNGVLTSKQLDEVLNAIEKAEY